MSRANFLPVLATSLCLTSCATLTKVGQSSITMVQRTSAATTSKIAELSELSMSKIRPAGVKVVEVREKDLKEIPTGQERALAYENSRKRSFWGYFSGPVDFKEPNLPEPGAEMDGSLLPPKGP